MKIYHMNNNNYFKNFDYENYPNYNTSILYVQELTLSS